MKSLHEFSAKDGNGADFHFSSLKGKKVLIVNTASECGFTPQYGLLQELYDEFSDSGFEIIAFPANDFGGQEPGTDEEIAEFCSLNYGVTFPIMKKIKVIGKGMHPLYDWLTDGRQNGKGDFEVTWNFQKFCIDEAGKLIKVLEPEVPPGDEWVVNWLRSGK